MKTDTIALQVPPFQEPLAVAGACTKMFVEALRDLGIMDEMIAACLMVAASDMGFLELDSQLEAFEKQIGSLQ